MFTVALRFPGGSGGPAGSPPPNTCSCFLQETLWAPGRPELHPACLRGASVLHPARGWFAWVSEEGYVLACLHGSCGLLGGGSEQAVGPVVLNTCSFCLLVSLCCLRGLGMTRRPEAPEETIWRLCGRICPNDPLKNLQKLVPKVTSLAHPLLSSLTVSPL